MAAKEFPLAHYLLATQGIGLIRSWAIDDHDRSDRFIREIAEICGKLDQPPYRDTLRVTEQQPVTGYTAWAPTYDRDNVRNPLIPLESEVLDELLHPVPSGRALDAACGTGRQGKRLLSLGYEVTGVDATRAMLEVARRAHPEIRYLQGDLRELPLPEAEFDLVLSTLALTHVAELELIITEFARVLRPGGRAVIVDVHPVQVLLGAHVTVAQDASAAIAVRNHVHLPSRYLAAFRRLGLSVEACLEPLFSEASVADLPAAEYYPEANRTAFVGTPALLAWSLRKDPKEAAG